MIVNYISSARMGYEVTSIYFIKYYNLRQILKFQTHIKVSFPMFEQKLYYVEVNMN